MSTIASTPSTWAVITSFDPYATSVGIEYALGLSVWTSGSVTPNSAESMLNTRRTIDWYPSWAPTSAKSCAARNPIACRGVNTIGLSSTWNAMSLSMSSRYDDTHVDSEVA